MVRYPSGQDGMPLNPELIKLPASRLRETKGNKNIHHLLFPARRYYYGGIIYASLRDVESLQIPMQKDIHNEGKNTLHTIYSPPEIPTPTQAIDYLLGAYEREEQLRFRHDGHIVHAPISDELMNIILTASYREIA